MQQAHDERGLGCGDRRAGRCRFELTPLLDLGRDQGTLGQRRGAFAFGVGEIALGLGLRKVGFGKGDGGLCGFDGGLGHAARARVEQARPGGLDRRQGLAGGDRITDVQGDPRQPACDRRRDPEDFTDAAGPVLLDGDRQLAPADLGGLHRQWPGPQCPGRPRDEQGDNDDSDKPTPHRAYSLVLSTAIMSSRSIRALTTNPESSAAMITTALE